MPVLGDHIQIEIDEIEKPARAYRLAIPTSTKKNQKVKYATKPTMASKHDMFRYGLIHFDMCPYTLYLHLSPGGGRGGDSCDKCHRNQFGYGLML